MPGARHWSIWINGICFSGRGKKVWYIDDLGRWNELPDLKNTPGIKDHHELRELASKIKLKIFDRSERSLKTSSTRIR